MASSTLWPDQAVSAALPAGQLHQLGVQQRQPDGRVERADRDQELEDGGLAGAGLAAQQQVALRQRHRDLRAVLVHADQDRPPQRQLPGPRQRPGDRGGVGQRVAADDDDPGVTGAVGVAGDADLAGVQERGQAFGPASRSGTCPPAGTRTRSCSPARVSLDLVMRGTRSLRVAKFACRQASTHRLRRCERNSATASGSRVQFTSPTTTAAATTRRSAA
jgi:hypothetical protein